MYIRLPFHTTVSHSTSHFDPRRFGMALSIKSFHGSWCAIALVMLDLFKQYYYPTSSAFIASSIGAPLATRFATIPSFVNGV
jgi:hypothetical protein